MIFKLPDNLSEASEETTDWFDHRPVNVTLAVLSGEYQVWSQYHYFLWFLQSCDWRLDNYKFIMLFTGKKKVQIFFTSGCKNGEWIKKIYIIYFLIV